MSRKVETDENTLDESDDTLRRKRNGALLSVLAALLCVVGTDVTFRVSHLRGKLVGESRYTNKPAVWTSDEQPTDVVFLGDSRVLHGVDPRTVEQGIEGETGQKMYVYNAGISGAPPMAHLAWLRRFLTSGHPLKVAVVSLSPYMFSSKISHDPSRESLHTIFRIVDIPAMFRAGAGAEDLATVFDLGLFESLRYRSRLAEILTKWSGLHDSDGGGIQGYAENPEVDAATQASRAESRAKGYKAELGKPEAKFGNEQMGYFLETLRELKSAHVKTIVLNSPSATQLDGVAYGPSSIYEEHVRYIAEKAREFGFVYVDARHPPALADIDFTDGDHLNIGGASRYSAWLSHEVLVPLLGGPKSDRQDGCKTLFDFEEALGGWNVSGKLSSNTTVQRHGQSGVVGFRGHQFYDTFVSADSDTGDAVSPRFPIDNNQLCLRVGGGSSGTLSVSLEVDGARVNETRGDNSESLSNVCWDVSTLRGKSAQLHVHDGETGGWGHLLLDDVALCP